MSGIIVLQLVLAGMFIGFVLGMRLGTNMGEKGQLRDPGSFIKATIRDRFRAARRNVDVLSTDAAASLERLHRMEVELVKAVDDGACQIKSALDRSLHLEQQSSREEVPAAPAGEAESA